MYNNNNNNTSTNNNNNNTNTNSNNQQTSSSSSNTNSSQNSASSSAYFYANLPIEQNATTQNHDDLLHFDLDFFIAPTNPAQSKPPPTRSKLPTNPQAYYNQLQRPPPLCTPAVITSNFHQDQENHSIYSTYSNYKSQPATTTSQDFNSNVDLSTDLDSILLDDYLDPNNNNNNNTSNSNTNTNSNNSNSNSQFILPSNSYQNLNDLNQLALNNLNTSSVASSSSNLDTSSVSRKRASTSSSSIKTTSSAPLLTQTYSYSTQQPMPINQHSYTPSNLVNSMHHKSKKLKTSSSNDQLSNQMNYYDNYAETNVSHVQKPSTTSTNYTTKSKKYDEFKCWVCGDTSSGNHYGALTCEACKLFFRRHSSALQSNNQSASPSSASTASSSSNSFNQSGSTMTHCVQRNCPITSQTRSSCPDCRYRKCIAVGMGLNRTTFGRHTSIQKSKYNAKCNDLFAEIMKLFTHLRDNITNKLLDFQKLNCDQLENLLIPMNTSGFQKRYILKRSDLEASLLKFYNDVVELMSPQVRPSDQKIPINILITFCLIFGYNLLNTSNRLLNPSLRKNVVVTSSFDMENSSQLKHIQNQIKQIDQQFESFAIRIKIIYFLLIMYTSFSMISNNSSSSNSNHESSNQMQTNSEDSYVLAINNDETNDIQRTFLDLLNSELDYQKNTVASTRVSLLLKLDQFI